MFSCGWPSLRTVRQEWSNGPNWECTSIRPKMSIISVDIMGYNGIVNLLASGLPLDGWGQKPPMAALFFAGSTPSCSGATP